MALRRPDRAGRGKLCEHAPPLGTPAPDFELSSQHGERIRLSGLRRRPVTLVFFPLAFSGVCTSELSELRDSAGLSSAAGVQLVGISVDSKASLRAWGDRERWNFPLLADFWRHGDVARRYEIFLDDTGYAARGTFVVDAGGILRDRFVSGPGEARPLARYRASLMSSDDRLSFGCATRWGVWAAGEAGVPWRERSHPRSPASGPVAGVRSTTTANRARAGDAKPRDPRGSPGYRIESSLTDVRERILASAYPLYVARGIRDVTVDEIERMAGVSHADFEREFRTRDALAAECLERREREWTFGVVEAGARARGTTPEERLLAIFDVFDEWFGRDDYEACTFINVLLEMGREHPLGRASAEYLVHIRRLVGTLATEAGLRDPDDLALSWHILMKGSIINAVEGDVGAARRAKEMARDLIERHRPARGGAAGTALSGRSAIRAWWRELTAATRVLVAVNGVVIAGVSALAAVLPLMP